VAPAALERALLSVRQDYITLDLNSVQPVVNPTMVWQASPQTSVSMLYPAYQVDMPGQTVYVHAADAAIFGEFIGFDWFRLGG
jgi:hypothetical protein